MRERMLVVLRGPAGAGKSALAEALRDRLGYPAAAIDTDMFNWTTVPGESNKQVVYDNVCLLAESYLRHGYDVVLSGLIFSFEERGALASLRARGRLLGWSYWDFYCHVPLDVAKRRSADRARDVPAEFVEKWWHDARGDVSSVLWPVRELDMQRPVESNVEEIISLLQPD
ncbi:AAA family ATPase [Phytoactinopolyspora endophytica]|uniref:AAA family ATPase n=1 Tax=Phytoactinopolyspora endophytica TaxID=1642495 RepID=UPI00101DC647|nr:AAA family ATPase [Phytoactinopolyspora endophytica]